MHVRLQPSLADERGFTLIELLVVILILGILAMIALPAFLNQRMKGQDTVAQTTARTIETAVATYAMDADTYNATQADLVNIEPTLDQATPDFTFSGTKDTYEVTVTSKSTTTFTVQRAADGAITRTCSIPERGRCRADSTW
jgi:type IV pilus assembly protein PilA